MEVKAPITFQEQAARLQSRGYLVNDVNACVAFLREANYYRLSAYLLPFRQADGTDLPGIPLARIKRIYEFDSHIRALIFQAIEHIELYLRTQLSYYFGHRYGALGYCNPANYAPRHNADRFQQKLHATAPMYLESWLRCITDLRNRCAHYSRLYFWNFTAIPKAPRGAPAMDRRLFSQIIVLKYLYPDPSSWNNNFKAGISALLEAYLPDIELAHIGFPDDWEDLLTASENT